MAVKCLINTTTKGNAPGNILPLPGMGLQLGSCSVRVALHPGKSFLGSLRAAIAPGIAALLWLWGWGRCSTEGLSLQSSRVLKALLSNANFKQLWFYENLQHKNAIK